MKSYNCIHCGKENKSSASKSNKFCDNVCQGHYRRALWIIENESKFQNGTLPSRAAIKKYVKLRDGENCSICGQLPEHYSKPLTMILDHIDGNSENNLPENFRLVCPNCDSQLPTYKARNKGNGRATKGKPWYHQI